MTTRLSHDFVHFRDPAAGCQLTWFDFGLNLPARLSDQSPQSSGQLVRVDSRSGQIVQRLAVANPGAFALAGGSLWVANFWTGQMSRIDPQHLVDAPQTGLP